MEGPSLEEKLKLAGAMFGGAKPATAASARCLSAFVLYEDDEGTTGTVTLSDSAANYTFIDIVHSTGEGRVSGTTRVYQPNGKTVEVSSGLVGSNGFHGIWFGRYEISGKTMTPSVNYRWTANLNGVESAYVDSVSIITVIGYR